MTDYLNPDKIYPDDISRRIDTPPGFDSVRTPVKNQSGSANQSEKTPQVSPELFPDCLQQLENDSTVCRKKAGGKGIMANQCIHCGQEMSEGDQVCGYCRRQHEY